MTQVPGTARPKPGRTWAARTGRGTRGGGRPRRSWTPGSPAAAAAGPLRAAAAAAGGHAPLLAQIRTLAERARIPLHPAAAGEPEAPPPARLLTRYGLTDRELTVLRLLAAGRTNSQIGAELYISASTASVHVSNILRKLGVSGRVQAAAIAERAGLLASPPP